MKRSAQVTLFVIFGIVIVIGVALALLLLRTPTEPEISTHDFDAAVASYENQVSYCVKDTGYDAFRIIFSQGGFAHPQEQGFVAIRDAPLRGSALALSDDVMIPYWLEHQGGVSCRGSCPLAIHIPPLRTGSRNIYPSIEEQAQKLISERLPSCLDRISLGPDYSVQQHGTPEVVLTIGQELITYQVNAPTTIIYLPTSTKKEVSMFTTQEAADISKLYDIGVALLQQLEISNVSSSSIGDVLVQIVEAYGMDERVIPPMHGGTSFETSSSKIWVLPDVKKNLRTYFADNIPLVNVQGTQSQTLFLDDNPYSLAVYHSGPFSPSLLLPHPQKVTDLSIDFWYDRSWDIDVRIQPGNGYVIRPDSTQFSPIPFLRFGLTDYRFTYDVRVPIVIIISDPKSFSGKGITLRYALETGIMANKPLVYADTDVLEPLSDTTYLFDDDDQRLDGLVTITARDALTQQPLPEVQLNFLCGDVSASAGITNSTGQAATTLPFCLGGTLLGYYPEYFSSAQRVSSVDDAPQEVILTLSPIKEFDLVLGKLMLSKVDLPGPVGSSWELGDAVGVMNGEDEAMIVLSRKSLPGEESFVTMLMVNASNYENSRVRLAVGEYDVELYVVRHFVAPDRFVVPEDTYTWDEEPLNPFGGEKSQTIPAVVFNESLMVGGMTLLAGQELSFVVTPDDLASNTLTLRYVEVALDDIRKHDDLAVLGDIEAIALAHADVLRPTFSTSS